MKRAAILPALMLMPAITLAQDLPRPDQDNPRLQTVAWVDEREVMLTALPQTGLTVMLEPGEEIRRVVLGQQGPLEVQVSAERDSFLILPRGELADLSLLVQTDRRNYPFRVRTESSLTAAYLVRFTYAAEDLPLARGDAPAPDGNVWTYRLTGDRSVRPAAISDDGVRTAIAFAPDQPLPAVFAIGPTGEEEVVNGYMRDDLFVIDRVHGELVFRIDKAQASARRAKRPEPGL